MIPVILRLSTFPNVTSGVWASGKIPTGKQKLKAISKAFGNEIQDFRNYGNDFSCWKRNLRYDFTSFKPSATGNDPFRLGPNLTLIILV